MAVPVVGITAADRAVEQVPGILTDLRLAFGEGVSYRKPRWNWGEKNMKMFDRVSVRLWLLALMSVGLILSVAGTGFYGLHYLHRGLGSALAKTTDETEILVAFQHAQSHLHSQVVAWKNILLRGHDEPNFNRHLTEFTTEEAQVVKYLKAGKEQLSKRGMPTQNIQTLLDKHKEMGDRYRVALKRFNPSDHNAGHAVDDLVVGNETAPLASAEKLMDELEQHARKLAADAVNQADGIYSGTVTIFGVLAPLGVVLSLIASLLIIRGLLRQLGGEPVYAADITQRIASGALDFEVLVRPGDETSLLASMRRMQTSIREAVSEVRSGSAMLLESARALSATSRDLSSATDEQKRATLATAEAVNRITERIGKIAESINVSEATAVRSGDLSLAGERIVLDASHEMQEVAHTVSAAAGHVTRLGEASREIFGIVSTIREIADQTNLLALNAAIEAARAGEQGRGFAVVADEVRKLAERTATATQEITERISGIETTTGEAVDSMNEGTQRVNHGVEKATEAAQSMADIRRGSKDVVSSVSLISAALMEQRSATDDVVHNVEVVTDWSTKNADTVNRLAESASGLEVVAEALQKAASRFTL